LYQKDSELGKITCFLEEIGVQTCLTDATPNSFLPGTWIESNTIFINPTRLDAPGDVLHEAGHFCVTPSRFRPLLKGDLTLREEDIPPAFTPDFLENEEWRYLIQGDESAAIGWSYCAAIAIGLDPYKMHTKDSFEGDWEALVQGMEISSKKGRSMSSESKALVYTQMTIESLFPKMLRWVQL